MPELPEVETIRRGLEQELLGRTLLDLHVKERVHLLKNCSPAQLRRALIGRRLKAVGRRGKFLIFDFERSEKQHSSLGQHSIVLHLRMSGRLLLVPAQHTRLILKFSDKTLYFDDARRFGMLYLFESALRESLPPLSELGIEPLTPAYTFGGFRALLQSKQEIKRLLLDQRKLCGLGNIYANEALFAAGIHPQRPACSLSSREARRLFEAIAAVLTRAIEAGGTSIDSYRTPQGELGRFQEEFSVYERAGKPCYRCGELIESISQGGRSSYFCPCCQTQ